MTTDNQPDIEQLSFDRRLVCELKAKAHDMTAHFVGDNLVIYQPNKPKASIWTHEYLYGD